MKASGPPSYRTGISPATYLVMDDAQPPLVQPCSAWNCMGHTVPDPPTHGPGPLCVVQLPDPAFD